MKRLLSLIVMITVLLSCEDKPTKPVLTTNSPTELTTTSTVSGGVISNDGGAPIISKGVCWNTSDNPTIDNNKTIETGESTSFASNLTQLSPKTLYYVRAYATNSAGTGYGTSISFTTLGNTPGPVSNDASNIMMNSATLNGTVNPNLLSTTVAFEWGTTASYGNSITPTQSPVIGNTAVNISANLTGLTPGTTYHFRVKATNELGTSNSDDMTFTTLGQVPSVFTLDATDISVSFATLNGFVNPNLLSTTVAFEWGTTASYGNSITPTQSPVIGNTFVNLSADLSGLTEETTYHYRIKAENSLGATYGIDKTFTTSGKSPVPITLPATGIQMDAATLNGNVNANGFSSSVTFEWGTTTDYGNTITAVQSPLTTNKYKDVDAVLTGLTPGTVYHYRIKATNEFGIRTSDDLTFSTLTPLTDIDGNVYNIRLYGTQLWMTDNLKTTRYSNGDDIGTTTPATLDISAERSPKYQWAYNGDEANVATYGRLYTLYAVTDNRNICPTGWHVPSDEQWTILTTYLGGESLAGEKLKESGTTHWLSPNTGTNESLFTALPGGYRFNDGTFSGICYVGFWWTSYDQWYRSMFHDLSNVRRYQWSDIKSGFSVVCIKD